MDFQILEYSLICCQKTRRMSRRSVSHFNTSQAALRSHSKHIKTALHLQERALNHRTRSGFLKRWTTIFVDDRMLFARMITDMFC